MSHPSNLLSPELAYALGVDTTLPTWTEIREALGIHLPPNQLIPILEHYSDDLNPPKLPRWNSNEITSPYDLRFNELSEDDKDKVRELSDGLRKRPLPGGWHRKLRDLKAKYPDVPLLDNLEVNFYRFNGNQERWYHTASELYERYPGYLFAACSLASYELMRNRPENVPAIFNEQIELEDYLGSERICDASEVAAFYGIMAWYHLFNQRLVRAAICMSVIHAARPGDSFLDTLSSWLMLLPDRALYALAKTLRASEPVA